MGDFETNLAYFAFIKRGVLPHELFDLPERGYAAICAFFDVYLKENKKIANKLKK